MLIVHFWTSNSELELSCVCRPADSSEIAAIPANWSLVLFRRRLQVRAPAVSAEAPHEKLVVAQEQCEADLATCQEAPAAPQSMPDLPASVSDPASDGVASLPPVPHDLGVSCLGCAALELDWSRLRSACLS